MDNLTFLPPAFEDTSDACRKAKAQTMGDPCAACFRVHLAKWDNFAAVQHCGLRGEL